MKIGFFCESPADQAAMRIFAEGILGSPPEPISMDLEARSVTELLAALNGVYRGVHFNSDAEALIIVVDSDDSPLHDVGHDSLDNPPEKCRYCQVKKIIARARNQLKPRQGRPELKLAIGLGVPAIEAWYLAGTNHQVLEATWRSDTLTGRTPRPRLKELVYGTDRPSLELETECAEREARRIVSNLRILEDAFPIGFGLLAHEIRSWAAGS